jgi:hypothetical protein
MLYVQVFEINYKNTKFKFREMLLIYLTNRRLFIYSNKQT